MEWVCLAAFNLSRTGLLEGQNPAVSKMLVMVSLAAIFLPGHLIAWNVERAFVLMVASLGLFCAFAWKTPDQIGGVKTSTVLGILFLVSFSYLLAYFLSMSSVAAETGFRDYIELIRYLVWAAFMVVLAQGDSETFRKYFVRGVKASFLYSAMVAGLILSNFPILSTFFADVLYGGTKTRMVVGQWVRLAVPFENPNFLAFYLVLSVAYILFFEEKNSRYLWVLLALILLALSGSRSGWIAAGYILIVFIVRAIFNLAKRINLKESIAGLAIFIPLAIYLVTFQSGAVLENQRVALTVKAIDNGGILEEPNLAGRLALAANAIDYFAERPLFGWGSMKYSTMDVVDNQFANLLLRNGIVGTMLLISIAFLFFYKQVLLAGKASARPGVFAFWGAALVMLQTGAFFDNFRLGFIGVLLVILIDGKLKQRVEADHKQGLPKLESSKC